MSSKEAAKAAAKKLVEMARSAHVGLPSDPTVATVAAGQVLLMHKEGNVFDYEAALQELTQKYGVVKHEGMNAKGDGNPPRALKVKRGTKKGDAQGEHDGDSTKKRTHKVTKEDSAKDGDEAGASASVKPTKRARPKKQEEGEGSGDDESPSKKKSKKKVAACTANSELAECFRELGGHCFKEGDRMRGSALMRVYSALMEHPEAITSGKQAGKIKNIGKSSVLKIDEYLATGKMEALEIIREQKNEVM